MSELCRFLGIVISMYHREHGPAHFHAFYSGHWLVVNIESGELRGWFPPRARRHVMEWLELHRRELFDNWQRAGQKQPLRPIEPLE